MLPRGDKAKGDRAIRLAVHDQGSGIEGFVRRPEQGATPIEARVRRRSFDQTIRTDERAETNETRQGLFPLPSCIDPLCSA